MSEAVSDFLLSGEPPEDHSLVLDRGTNNTETPVEVQRHRPYR